MKNGVKIGDIIYTCEIPESVDFTNLRVYDVLMRRAATVRDNKIKTQDDVEKVGKLIKLGVAFKNKKAAEKMIRKVNLAYCYPQRLLDLIRPNREVLTQETATNYIPLTKKEEEELLEVLRYVRSTNITAIAMERLQKFYLIIEEVFCSEEEQKAIVQFIVKHSAEVLETQLFVKRLAKES